MAATPFLPAALLLAVWVAWIPLDGGYFGRAWYPGAMFAVALLAVVALATRRLMPPARPSRVALALLTGFTAWSFASLLWADSPGGAWAASDQLLLYLATAWVVALVRWRGTPAATFLGCWSIAVAVACAVELASGLGASHLGHYFREWRWQQPTGYANTAAAIAAMASLPAAMLASRRGVHAALRVLFVLVATFLVEFSLLPQSRVSLVALALAIVLFVVLAPDRLRILPQLAIVGLALAIAVGPIWDVYGNGAAGRPLDAALDRAAESMAVSLLVAVAAGVLVAIAERRVRAGPRTVVALRRGALAGVVAASLAGAGLAAANAGDVASYAGDRWDEFKSNGSPPPDRNPTRILQGTSDKRYDYWRVSVATFRESPVGGVGAGGFEGVYLRERRHPKPSRSPHSVWMRALIETGAVGVTLFVALVVVAGWAMLRIRPRLDDGGRAVVAATAAVGLYFLLHASFDWLELMPAVAAPAVAFPFVALGLAGPPATRARAPRYGRRWLAAAGGLVLALAAVASLVLPYLAERYVDTASRNWRADPAGSDRDLKRAADLNPLSPRPRIVEGRIALERGRYADARRAFESVLDVEDGWYPRFELALLDSREGHFRSARREIARAHALNPPDPLVQRAIGIIARRMRIDPARVDRKNLALPLYKDPRHL